MIKKFDTTTQEVLLELEKLKKNFGIFLAQLLNFYTILL